jgi:cytochrome oxidase assembly protein ShyY1
VSTEEPEAAADRPPLTRRDLRSGRWIAAHAGIAVLAIVFVFLGRWQWHAGHKVAPLTVGELTAWHTAQPVDSVITPDGGLDGTRVGQAVTATGTYDATRQLLVPGRTLDGRSGYYLIAPLVTGPGQGVVVDRGWLAAAGSARPAIPAPPPGRVTVTGWAAEPEAGTGAVNANGIVQAVPTEAATGAGEVPMISPAQLVNLWPYHLLDGYIAATDPGSTRDGLTALPDPLPAHGTSWDLLNVGYAFQWCLFAVILIGWYGLHLSRELAGGQAGEQPQDEPEAELEAEPEPEAEPEAELEAEAEPAQATGERAGRG